MTSRLVIVKAAYDLEAEVWYVEDSDLHGVNAWASTLEELRDKLPAVILDLLDEQGDAGEDSALDVPIEVIAHLSTRARRDTVA
jgi:predicted RNase H-like HicB family nuclease